MSNYPILLYTYSKRLILYAVGAPVAGTISDKAVIYYRKSRGGVWYPEDRLRATLIGTLVFVPLSVLGSGLLTAYVPGKLGLVLNLICLFFNGIGVSPVVLIWSTPVQALRYPFYILQVDFVLSPMAAYIVDLLHSRSAEAMAAGKYVLNPSLLLINSVLSSRLPLSPPLQWLSLDFDGIRHCLHPAND